MKKLAAISLSVLLLAGCSQNGGYDGRFTKSDAGTVLGGVGGAVVGAQFGKGNGRLATTAVGALLGAALGNSIGASLDRVDTMYHERAAQTAFESNRSGTAATWSNPDTGHSGSITPLNVSQRSNGEYCREYRQTIKVGGKSQEGYGTACRQPDGSWQVVN
ncbi:glycine zipper 2TM domain-containing protein [bacterium]|nr:glycine zipper 2TM domain-containing protein [bacterium]